MNNPLDFDPANVITGRGIAVNVTPGAIYGSRDRYSLIAACMMHVEGYYSIKSLAFKNRNPGNIENPDGTMRQYGSPQAGFAALVTDIQVNAGKTLRSFLFKYAPPSENDTNSYLAIVSQLSGIAPDETI